MERDLRLLHLEHRERGDHTFTLFNLGMTYADIGQHQEAEGYLRRSIATAQPNESHLRKAYALLVYTQARLGRPDDSWRTCAEGLRLFPKDPELTFRQAILLHERGELAAAVRTYLALLSEAPERHFTSVDRGLRGFKARFNLAVVYRDQGDLARAEEQLRLVIQEQPGFRPAWRELATLLLGQGRQAEAAELAGKLAGGRLRVESLIVEARMATARSDHAAARGRLEQAMAEFPDDEDVWQDWSRFAFEHATPAEAEQALRGLLSRWPDDASAHHNLGTVHLWAGRPDLAAEEFRESLRLRPDSPGTRAQLEAALRAAGQGGERKAG